MNGEFLDKMSAKMGEILELTGMNGKIPPRTADIVEYTRAVKGLVNAKTIDSSGIHSGWSSMQRLFVERDKYPQLITEKIILTKELSEMWDVPFSWMSVFDFVINDEPAQMTYAIVSAKPPLVDGKTTGLTQCMAYDGVEKGWWGLKDIDLPPPSVPIGEHEVVRGLAVWMAEGVEKNE